MLQLLAWLKKLSLKHADVDSKRVKMWQIYKTKIIIDFDDLNKKLSIQIYSKSQ